jgi:hypothetical protein
MMMMTTMMMKIMMTMMKMNLAKSSPLLNKINKIERDEELS